MVSWTVQLRRHLYFRAGSDRCEHRSRSARPIADHVLGGWGRGLRRRSEFGVCLQHREHGQWPQLLRLLFPGRLEGHPQVDLEPLRLCRGKLWGPGELYSWDARGWSSVPHSNFGQERSSGQERTFSPVADLANVVPEHTGER